MWACRINAGRYLEVSSTQVSGPVPSGLTALTRLTYVLSTHLSVIATTIVIVACVPSHHAYTPWCVDRCLDLSSSAFSVGASLPDVLSLPSLK